MRTIFMGSSEFSCPSLRTVMDSDCTDLVGIVCQPDRPKGRGRHKAACPVGACAPDGYPLFTPPNVKLPEFVAELAALNPDLIVIVSYGQLVSPALLELPKLGCINVHGSLLPQYRGAAPVQWAVTNGDPSSGVTTMYVTPKMDSGDIILMKEIDIDPDETGGEFYNRLAEHGGALLNETISLIAEGKAPRTAQDESRVTFAPKLRKRDGRIDWTMGAKQIYDRIRGFNPWPCCFCEVPEGSGVYLRVLRARIEDGGGEAGAVLEWSGDGPLVAAGCGRSIRLLQVQSAGKNVMDADAYMRGHQAISRIG